MAKKDLEKLVGPLRMQVRTQVEWSMTDAQERQYRAKGPHGGRQRLDAKPKGGKS
jgi:hypothetical protein